MKLFQIWILINSSVFIMVYFLLFLLLKYSYKKSILICSISTILTVGIEILRVIYAFDIIWVKPIESVLQIIIIQGTALLLSEKKDSYTVFIGFSSFNFVLGCRIFRKSYSCYDRLYDNEYISFSISDLYDTRGLQKYT